MIFIMIYISKFMCQTVLILSCLKIIYADDLFVFSNCWSNVSKCSLFVKEEIAVTIIVAALQNVVFRLSHNEARLLRYEFCISYLVLTIYRLFLSRMGYFYQPCWLLIGSTCHF